MASGRGTVGNLLVNMRVELGQLRTDVKEIEKTFSSGFANIKTSAASFGRDLASSLGIGLSVGAVIGFAKQVIDLGSRLKDLQVQTGISAQTLSGLKSVLEENGTSLEAFATGIFRLQKELGTIKNESDPTAQAIKQLGLNLDQLRNADTETFLKLITDALAKQENPINRAALGFQLMGRTMRELIPAVLEMAGRIEELRKKGITEQDVKILDDFADSWTRASNQLKIAAAIDISGSIKEWTKALKEFQDLFGGSGGTKGGLAGAIESVFGQTFTQKLQSTQKEFLGLTRAIYETIISIAEWRKKFTFNDKDLQSLDQFIARFRGKIETINAQLSGVGRRSFEEGLAGAEQGTGGGRFKSPVDDGALKKARDELAKVAEGIDQENEKLQEQIIELQHGKDAADDWTLSQKEMREAAKGMTADILQGQEHRRALIEDLRREVTERQILIGLIQESRKTPIEEEITFGLTPEQTAEAIEGNKKLDEQILRFKDDWAKMRQELSINIISDDQQRRVAELTFKFIELAKALQKAGDAANRPQQEIDQAIQDAGRAFTREAVGRNIDPAVLRAQQLGESIGDSITSGIRNTLMGIETGQQSVSEGLKNMLRNIGLELQFLMFDETILKPIKAFAKGFVTGLFDSISDQFEKDMGELGKRLGKALKELLDSLMNGENGVGQWISKGLGIIGSLFGMGGGSGSIPIGGGGFGSVSGPVALSGGLIQAFAKGGPVLSFASGGAVPILAHTGEFVMNRRAVSNVGASVMSRINDSGRLPQGNTVVNINGSIIPNDPNARRDEIIQVMISDADNNGPHFRTLHNRSSVLSKG